MIAIPFLFLSVSILSEGDKAISHRLGGHVSVGGSHGRRKTVGLVPVLSSTKEAGDVSIVVVLWGEEATRVLPEGL